MATYVYRCLTCYDSYLFPARQDAPACRLGHSLVRDWRAEGVGLGSGVRESRVELSPSGYRELFLPTEEDLAMPGNGDPTGKKAMKEWMEEHQPKDGNKRPILPEYTKDTFYMGGKQAAPAAKE